MHSRQGPTEYTAVLVQLEDGEEIFDATYYVVTPLLPHVGETICLSLPQHIDDGDETTMTEFQYFVVVYREFSYDDGDTRLASNPLYMTVSKCVGVTLIVRPVDPPSRLLGNPARIA